MKNDLKILDGFMELPLNVKQDNVRLLLEFNNYYTSSSSIMRLYDYLDIYSRNTDKYRRVKYDGNVPTDFSIYLSFFEVVYLAIATKTIDISLVDSLFRFRFFGACNNPEIQKSELLPLSYQYPNIFDLYILWSEYLRLSYISNEKADYFFDEMTLFEYDLIKRTTAYNIINKRDGRQTFRLINSKAIKIDVEVEKLNESHYEICLQLQTDVLAGITENAKRIFLNHYQIMKYITIWQMVYVLGSLITVC